MEVGEGLLPPLPLPLPEPPAEPVPDPMPEPDDEPLPLFDPEFEPDPAEDPDVPEPLLPVPGCDTEGVGEGVLFAVVSLEVPTHPVNTSPALTRTAVKNHERKGIRAAVLYISSSTISGALPNTDGERKVWCCETSEVLKPNNCYWQSTSNTSHVAANEARF